MLAGAEAADLLPADLWTVRRAHAERFGPGAGAAGAGGRRPLDVSTTRGRPARP